MTRTSGGRPGKRGLPLFPTLVVCLIVPVLIGFGAWQLQRMEWKEALLGRMEVGAGKGPLNLVDRAIPSDAGFRTIRVEVDCPQKLPATEGGRNGLGRNGWVFTLGCKDAGGTSVHVVLGWNSRPDIIGKIDFHSFAGRQTLEGIVAPSRGTEWRLTLANSPPPLEPAQPPQIDDMPNNHLSYAIQWFSFAGILLVIYALWVKRWRQESDAARNGDNIGGRDR